MKFLVLGLVGLIFLFSTSYGNQTFSITGFNGTSAYIFNQTLYNPSLNVTQGEVITFVFSVNTTNHPFSIKTTRGIGNSNEYLVGVSQNPFIGIGNFTWNVSYSAPNVLYYQDELNANMGGTIFIEPVLVDCLNILNCTECLSYSTCNWCSSSTIQGCTNNTGTYQNDCSSLGGYWGDCSHVSSGTQCYLHLDCQSCSADPSCGYCQISTGGACLASSANSSFSSFVCGSLSGIFNSPCGSVQQVTTAAYNPLNPTSAIIDYNAVCQPFAGSVCATAVFYPVYVNETFSQTNMSYLANKIISLGSLPSISVACVNAATLLTCGEYFQECQTVTVGSQNVALSIPPCRSLCDQVNSNCASEFSAFGYPPLDCTGIDPRTEYWAYPQSSIVYDFPNGMVVTLPCNSMQISNDGYFPNILQNPNFQQLTANDQATYWSSVYGPNDYTIVNDTDLNIPVMEMINNGTLMLGASQTLQLNRNQPLNIRFGLTSKADNVSGTLDNTYAVHLSVTYADNSQDGSYIFFNPGNHTYETRQSIFTPSQGVQTATFSILFNQREGTTYFDNATLQEQIPPLSVNCLFPLEFNPDYQTNAQGICAVPCLVEIWPKSQTDALWYTSITLSWFSFIASILLTATWILRQKVKNVVHLDSTILYFSICTLMLSFSSGFWDSIFGQYGLFCKNKFEYYDEAVSEGGWPCVIQAFIVEVFSLALILWWMINIVKLYCVIVFPHRWGKYFLRKSGVSNATANRVELILNFFVWGSCLIVILFGIGFNDIGSSYGVYQCWISGTAYEFTTFYGPLMFCMVFGIPLIIHSLIIINKTRKAVNKPIHWKLTIRSLMLVCFLAVNFASLLYYKFYFQVNNPHFKEEYYASIICRSTSSTPDQCPPLPQPSLAPAFLTNILASTEGLTIFFIFGIQKRNFTLWRQVILGTASSSSEKNSIDKTTDKSGGSKKDSSTLELSNLEESTEK